jgi:hypothetical protein
LNLKMNKLLVYLLPIFFSLNILGQNLISVKKFDGSGNNQVFKSTIDSHNNIYIIGYFSGSVKAGGNSYTTKGTAIDAFISKYDMDGNLLWFKHIGSDQIDYITGLALSTDESSISIVGYYFGNQIDFGNGVVLENYATGTPDAFIADLDASDGAVKKVKRVAYGEGGQVVTDVCIDKNSNIILIGYVGAEGTTSFFDSNNSIICNGPRKYFILQLNNNYEINWLKQYTSDDVNNNFYSIDFDESGYYIAGMNRGNLNLDIKTLISQGPAQDMFLYKTDFNGNGQWVRSIKGSGKDVSQYATCDQQGHVYISGSYSSSDLTIDSTATLISARNSIPNKGLNDIFYAKYNTDGTLQWFNVAGSTGDDKLTRLSAYDHYFVIAGQFGGPMTFNNENISPVGGVDALGIVHDENDNLLYAIKAGGSNTDVNQTCLIDNQGNYIFVGEFLSPSIAFDASHSLTNSVQPPAIATRDVFIAKYKSRSISLVSSPVKCYGSATATISANAKGAWVGNKTYAWTKKNDASFSKNTSIIENVSSGTYYCKISDDLHFEVDSITLTDPAELVAVQNLQQDAKCYGSLDGRLGATVTGGTGAVSYLWSGTGAGIIATNQVQNTLAAGTYSLVVTDVNNCTDTIKNMVIAEPTLITFQNCDVTKINGVDGAVHLRIMGGTVPYLYSWSGPSGFSATTQDIGGIRTAGNYTVTVTDHNLCKRDTTFLIIDSQYLYAKLTNKKDISCKGGADGSLTVLAVPNNSTPSITYNWAGPNGYTGSTATINNLKAGVYSVTVTDVNQDPDEVYIISNIELTEPANELSVDLVKGDQACFGLPNGFIDANPSGGTLPYRYSWKKEGNSLPDVTEVIIGLALGSYEVTVLDTNNCEVKKAISINEPSKITAQHSLSPVSCTESKNDGTIDITPAGGTGAYTFHWSNGLTTEDVSLLSAGTYRCSITDVNLCTETFDFVVGQPNPLSASFTNTNVSCYDGENGSIALEVSGGNSSYNYSWSNGRTEASLNGLKKGYYSVTVTDGKNCQKYFSTSLTQPDEISVSATSIKHASCKGAADGSLSLSTQGGKAPYIWVWNDGKTGSSIDGLNATDHIVTIHDANSCTKSATFQIVEPSELVLTEQVDKHINVKCNGAKTGELEVSASGSSGQYQYSIDGTTWQFIGKFSNLEGGNHSVMVRDEKVPTCVKSTDISIIQPEAIAFPSASGTDITCNNSNNGKINAIATGGTAPLAYTLKLNGDIVENATGKSTGIFENLAEGENYTVEVTDANLCEVVKTSSLKIINPALLSVKSCAIDDITCPNLANGEVDVQVEGGSGNYTYALKQKGVETGNSTGASSGKFSGIKPGDNYTIEVTDGNNCPAAISPSFNLKNPEKISIATELVTKTSGIGLADGGINIIATGGTGTLNYILSDGTSQMSGSFVGLPKGNYTITVTDGSSCNSATSNPLIIDEPTAGVDLLKGGIVKIYPNPVAERVFVEINNAEYKSLKVELKNIAGKASISQKFENAGPGFKAEINLNNLPKGIYVVLLNDNIMGEKLIVQ